MKKGNRKYTTLLTIAGSDSIGGAGIQADLKTACVFGVYAMSAITSVTAQNTTTVSGKLDITPDFLRMQLQTVLDDVKPDAVKIGMIGNPDNVDVVSSMLKKYKCRNIVVDPVLISTSGCALAYPLKESAEAMQELLFPISTLVTPNLPEARYISGLKLPDNISEEDAIHLLDSFSAPAVLLKGGHADGKLVTDFLMSKEIEELPFGDNETCQTMILRTYRGKKYNTDNTHGTGCSLSSAIACCLASGRGLEEAVGTARNWLRTAIREGARYRFGHGHGPVYYFDINNEEYENNIEQLPF